MGYIEIFSADENGAGWKNLSDLTPDERLSLEIDVDMAKMGLDSQGLLCVVCYLPIPAAMGHNYCAKHFPN